MTKFDALVIIPKFDEDNASCVLDMFPLVLCKDCKFHDVGENEVDAWNRCCHHKIDTDDYKFCSDGERR